MFPIIRKWALAAMLSAGFTPTLLPAASPTPARASTSETGYRVNEIIIVEEPGKTDRRCIILSIAKQPDGTMAYQIKALATGERMTIYNRVPTKDVNRAAPVASPSAKFPGMNPNTAHGVALPQNIAGKIDANPPRAQEHTAEPWQNLMIPDPVRPSETSKTAMAPKPESAKPRSLVGRIFGKSEPKCSACNTCATPNPAQATSKTAVATAEPPIGRQPLDPVVIVPGQRQPIVHMPLEPSVHPDMEAQILPPPIRRQSAEPSPLPIYQAPINPVHRAGIERQSKLVELKQALTNAERPSHRMAAAEELAERGETSEVRAALMIAAQDDPAGCVRATCIRCLAKRGSRDPAIMTLLVAARKDKSPEVRDEAAYAVEKMSRR